MSLLCNRPCVVNTKDRIIQERVKLAHTLPQNLNYARTFPAPQLRRSEVAADVGRIDH
jgi:hypothetical protein